MLAAVGSPICDSAKATRRQTSAMQDLTRQTDAEAEGDSRT